VVISKTPRRQEMAYEQVLASITNAVTASKQLRHLDRAARDHALRTAATMLRDRGPELLEANAADLRVIRDFGYTDGQIDRLRLTEQRIAVFADEFDRVARLPDPLGELSRNNSQGPLHVTRVPIGVVGAVYEAQPSVVVETMAPALKAGNAVLLRGALAAGNTDTALVGVLRDAMEKAGLPADTVRMLPIKERSSTRHLVTARAFVGLVVLRGGAGMVRGVLSEATVPVVELGAGICHLYIDAAADLELATALILESKADPTIPHAVQTVLVHIDVAQQFVPTLISALAKQQVTVHGDLRVAAIVRDVVPAEEADWQTEYLSPDIAIGLVDTLDDALEHISDFGTGHSEVVVTRDRKVASTFVDQVDAAAVRVNAPTVGASDPGGWDAAPLFSTQKLHARGPIEPVAFTTTKWVTWQL
jgi:glutamate-5-semialdehyde dehydrogenase